METKKIFVKDILIITQGKLIIGKKDQECKNFITDTRKIKQGDIYIGLKGEKINGSDLWKEAFDKGAVVAIIEDIKLEDKDLEEYDLKGKVLIKVKDTLKALGQIATYKRQMYNIQVIGVTGSVGKTSTKDIIASVTSQKYKTLKTEGNNNNHIGLPQTILRLNDEEVAVIEMGMNHSGEIKKLTNIARPTISVITNIGTSHIGNLGSRENILKAKLEILEGMNEKVVVINNDNDLLHDWFQKNNDKYEIITYGINNKSYITAEEIKINENNSSFVCNINDKEKVEIEIPVGGEHFIYNAICAVAVGKKLKISNAQIINGIKNFELTKKRMEVIELKDDITLINDTYNASYESIKASLNYITTLNKKRKIAVLGDMLELGEFTKQLHEKVGEELVLCKIDILICSGENAKYIAERAKELGMPSQQIFYEENNKKIFERIEKEMKKGDIILIKASNGMKFFEIANKLINKLKK